ncbi:MAG: hypothetical protein JSR82_07630 [Verrucomicrobia bacterium]|nr:hypothetical protein [Verrucomicrobiota bacterium]
MNSLSLWMRQPRVRACLLLTLSLCALLPGRVRGEAMLQYFNTEWREIADKMPELAEAGYTSLWLPPPTKGSGGLSVGYDLWDRFDLGSKDQRGSVRTRYGTEADLLRLVEIAHRFGIRVYFDNIMNHNAFDVPGYNEFTPIDIYPGFVPEDFHLRVTPEGFYRKWDNVRSYGDAWQVQNLGLADLIDIAQETPNNVNFGTFEGAQSPKISFKRHPQNTEYYLDLDLPIPFTNPAGTFNSYTFSNKEPFQDVGYTNSQGAFVAAAAANGRFDFEDLNGNGKHDAGEPSEPFTDTGIDPTNPAHRTAAWGFGDGKYNMGTVVNEDVGALLIRSARWLLDRTKADGLRLDAVKHVPDYFFGQQSGAGKDYSSAGYLGQAQEQFNLTRGFSDWNNHRDSVFNSEQGRDDAMMFGEHLGNPPPYGGYWDAGMRLVDNDLRSSLNGILGNPSATLAGLDQPGGYGFAPALGVMHAQSHDNDYAARSELQTALYFTRAGIGLVYTDGNYQAQTLGQSGGAFPRHANTNFLGQYGDGRIPNMLYVHQQFARGDQIPKWGDNDVVAYERRDKRENGGMTDADGTTMLFMLNDNYASGQARSITTTFPNGAYLFNYSTYGGGFYVTVPANQQMNSVIIPPGGYFAFSWRSPEQTAAFAGSEVKPITIRQGTQPVGFVNVVRKDGPDGDPGFNPYGLPDANTTDYSYTIALPRVTDGTNLSFIARGDGSAENMLLELDGGVDVNSQMGLGPTTGELRDHPPALSTDTFLGYEQMQFVRRTTEKFAARNTTRNVIGSPGAESYEAVIGTAGLTVNNGSGLNTNTNTAAYIYHDPAATRDIDTQLQFNPPPQSAVNQPITVRVKSGYQFQISRVWLYYTTDGLTFPEGSGGVGRGTTQVVELAFDTHGNPDGSNITDWWVGTIPALPNATKLRYKIGGSGTVSPSVFPGNAASVDLKLRMETVFQVTGFNATTATVFPHNDYGVRQTGLKEGFHFLRVRQFLDRAGRASIYNTYTQTFYYDAERPGGEIKFPSNDGDTVGGSQYGVVVRADSTVTKVLYRILDGDPSNDDSATTTNNGNGAWVAATEQTASLSVRSQFDREFRFNYVNIPATGTATIQVRLLEVSSSSDMNLSDVDGHFTTLTRTVNTAGPDVRMFVAFPQNDGEVVGQGYVMKVYFAKSLADGTTTPQLISRFLIRIGSNEAGDAGVIQSPTGYSINYNVNAQFHELAYTLPNLYNDLPNFLHKITVTHTRPGNLPVLTATRLVRAFPAPRPPDIIFVNPPEFTSDGQPFVIVLPDKPSPTPEERSYTVRISTALSADRVSLASVIGTVLPGNFVLSPSNPTVTGNAKLWDFTWQNIQAGSYQFLGGVFLPGNNTTVADNTATRNVQVVFRQLVTPTPGDDDHDDDGLYNTLETTVVALPLGNPETWTNGDVHLYFISGKTDPLSPDTDDDGLPDGLESGWVTAGTATNPATDTNGDGVPNFIPDEDPPIFNTTDNATRPPGYELYDPWPYDLNRSRTDLIAGTMTNPAKADTDGDGLKDGVEDANRNGRVDIVTTDANGNITGVIKHPPTVYNTSRIDRTKLPAGALFMETDPNNGDSDGDGIPDGQEDLNGNGVVDLAIIDRDVTDGNGNFVVLGVLNDDSNALGFGNYSDYCYSYTDTSVSPAKFYQFKRLDKRKLRAAVTGFPRINPANGHTIDVIYLETDPRDADTDGDGLPDGWEVAHALDPLDSGIAGQNSLRTGKATLVVNGAQGDPDNDGFNNLAEFLNGTDPRVPNTGVPPPPNAIVIGPQNPPAVVGGVSNAKEFTDWKISDLVVLDEYDGDGPNNQGSDVYHAYDGFDSSRDIVAFYAHDGGAAAQGGDDKFYFRVDLHDLRAFAEQGNLDLYVVVNTGQPGSGERALPDDVDTATDMRWQVVVACYESNKGAVYVDTNPLSNSSTIGQELTQFGVQRRDQNTPNGFLKSYYNSDLDAVEFSISRQALLDAGWNGLNARDLKFQVFTTKDGTQNNPRGAGDIGGRSDIRDTIYDDFLASDYYLDQGNIAGSKSVLTSYFSLNGSNDNGRRVKVVSLVSGNHSLQPGNQIQRYINNDAGAGYYRLLDVHESYGVPVTLHITPALASALQWAKVDPAANKPYLDGPAFNARIAGLKAQGLIEMPGSTLADHVPGYFPLAYNADNIALANSLLTGIYGTPPSSRTLWVSEQVFDSAVLDQVRNLGFQQTFVTQQRHLFKWFGRQESVGNNGYRLNRINGVNCLVINNDGTANLLGANDDNGLNYQLRALFNRKARSGQTDQVVVLLSNWDDFGTKTFADAYDRSIRWLASRPWVQLVTPDQIGSGQVDLSVPADGLGDTWGTVDRGTQSALARVQRDYIDHATQEDYDNWYFGQAGREESLSDKRFNLRTGVQVPQPYGLLGFGAASTVVNATWTAVQGISNAGWADGLRQLARLTYGNSLFTLAFHNQTNNDLSKFSTGAYIYPDISSQSLASFSKAAQSQTRYAAIYKRVSDWGAAALANAYTNSAVAEAADVDLDGENEYLLFNDRVFAVFEALGGRMTAAWVRDLATGEIFQVVGNHASYSGSETEEEGFPNTASGDAAAYRTSGFKDWFANFTGGGGQTYTNDLYTVAPAAGGAGWVFTSSDGKIAKTIALGPRKNTLAASYALSGISTLFVRHGVSPNLLDLVYHGQANLSAPLVVSGGVDVLNTTATAQVRASLRCLTASSYNAGAVDDEPGSGVNFATVAMRNQAQTQQLELQGTNGMTFTLGFQTGPTLSNDSDGDGLPDWWEQQYGLNPNDPNGANGANGVQSADGLTNYQKYVFGLDPRVASGAPLTAATRLSATSVSVNFPTKPDRVYRIEWANSLTSGTWTPVGPDYFGNGTSMSYTDDGTETGSPPGPGVRRFYRVRVSLPQ